MNHEHTSLLDLPDVLTGMGLNVDVADGYAQGQCSGDNHYMWKNPDTNATSHDESPRAYMVHHTGSATATPPANHNSKANVWAGLKRGNRLYEYGGGTPTLYLATAGPARISAGDGYWPALSSAFEGVRPPVRAAGPDGHVAGNRYAVSVETVHRGGGQTLDEGVHEHIVGLGVALEQLLDRRDMTLGHLSWTRRKKDPHWNNDFDCIIAVQDAIAGGHVKTHYRVGEEDRDFEPLLWRMAWIDGLRINSNGNSAQIEDVFPWHQGVSVRIPMQEDFQKFGEMTSMHQASINKIINNGLYKNGLEIAALDERMYM